MNENNKDNVLYPFFGLIKFEERPLLVRFLLLFKKSQYSFDGDFDTGVIVRFKKLRGVTYVIDEIQNDYRAYTIHREDKP